MTTKDPPPLSAETRSPFEVNAPIARARGLAAASWSGVMARTFAIAVAFTLAVAIAFAFGTLLSRPLDIVEGEILFEAARLRDKLPLYIDPIAGAYDYGPVPSRYYVLYTPVWPYLLAHLPADLAGSIARLVSGVGWFGLLAVIARLATPSQRKAVLYAAAVAGGTYMLARNAATATADSVAVVIAGIALVRSARLGRVDALSGALFALGAWTKPNVIGIAAGAFLFEIFVGRARALRPILAALVVTGALAWWSHRMSGGAWIQHLTRSTMQPASAMRAVEEIASRLPLIGVPHVFAAYCGLRARDVPDGGRTRLVLTALMASLLWTIVSVGKVGSSTNYWLEPSIAAVLMMAYAPVPRFAWLSPRPVQLVLAVVALVALGLNSAASLRAIHTSIIRSAAVARARSTCGASPADLVMAEHPGYEMMFNGRLLETPYQMTHLARAQAGYPLELWKADVAAPQIRCLVMESDLLERPLAVVNEDDDRFGVELRAALTQRFELVARDAGLWIYRAREAPLAL